MKKEIQKWLDLGNGWTAQVNLYYDDTTLEVLHEEVVCSHKDVDYNLTKHNNDFKKPCPNELNHYTYEESKGEYCPICRYSK